MKGRGLRTWAVSGWYGVSWVSTLGFNNHVCIQTRRWMAYGEDIKERNQRDHNCLRGPHPWTAPSAGCSCVHGKKGAIKLQAVWVYAIRLVGPSATSILCTFILVTYPCCEALLPTSTLRSPFPLLAFHVHIAEKLIAQTPCVHRFIVCSLQAK